MTEHPGGAGTILFAQLDRFSYTNDAIAAHLPRHLPDYRVEGIRVYRRIVRNPALLAACLAAVGMAYGPRALLQRKSLNERLIKTPFFFRLASRILRRHARGIGDLAAVLQTQCLFDAKLPDTPLVLYTDNTVRNKINRSHALVAGSDAAVAQERATYLGATKLAVTSKHVRESLMEDYGVPAERIELVYIGANAPRHGSPAPGRYASRHILFVGIDWERKGGPTLIEAFRRVVERVPDARLTIVGCDPGIQVPGVSALGRVPPERVAELMGQSAVFCLPSLIEPSSVAAIEAARAGLPIVATRGGGFLDSVSDGQTGLLVPAGNADALADALTQLVSDPALAARMGAAAPAWVAKFDWNTVCGKIARLLTNAIAGQGA